LSPTTAPAGSPKSDCNQRRPDKYGASMTAKYGVVVLIRGLSSLLNYKRTTRKFLPLRQPKIYDAKNGCRFFGKN
jgi:hypothetical protein